MTASTFALPTPVPSLAKKKRVLLVDASLAKRDLRAEVMRKLGVDVDCAADIPEARSWWRADLYDLVLINMDKARGHRDRFCEDLRGATPPQQIAFLVGKPEYVADSPGADEESLLVPGDDHVLRGEIPAAICADAGGMPQRFGILEAARRISAVRSASSARTRAMKSLPAPPRDSEIRLSKRTAVPRSLDDLLKEEMQ